MEEKMKKLLTVAAVIVGLIVPSVANSASKPDEQWVAPSNYAADMQGYVVSESNMLSNQGSFFINFTTADGTVNGKVTKVAACNSVADKDCAFTVAAQYRAVIPMCSTDTELNCIASVIAKDADGKELAVTQAGQYPTHRLQDFAADPSINLPAGGGAALLNIPGAPHDGGTQYLLKVTLIGSRQPESQDGFGRPSLQSTFFAIKTVNGTYGDISANTDAANYDSINRISGNDTQGYASTSDRSLCVVKSQTECGLAYPMPEGITLGYTLRLARPVVGWLHGRMKGPVINLKSNPNGSQSISVEAKPIHVPSVSAWAKNAEISSELKTFYSDKQWSGSALRFGSIPNGPTPLSDAEKTPEGLKSISYQHLGAQFNAVGMQEFLLWLPQMKDTSAANPSMWTLNSMRSNGNPQDNVGKCLNQTDSLAGVVTTNSTMYIDGPPTYIASQGTLDYKVAATHFEPDGKTVFKGTYDLVMSSKVARCIYGFTSAPVSATVSVTSASGEPDVATIVVSENAGWLSLGAYNFTYSNPTIQVKLTQAAPVVAPAPVVKKSVSQSIICVNGKKTKKVTTATCPKGWKKK